MLSIEQVQQCNDDNAMATWTKYSSEVFAHPHKQFSTQKMGRFQSC